MYLVRGARPSAATHRPGGARRPGRAVGVELGGPGAQVVDAEGWSPCRARRPAHPPARARPRGRRDRGDQNRAAALGGFTAVHAMANTDPVADTAGVVEQVWRLGRRAGWVDVRPWVR